MTLKEAFYRKYIERSDIEMIKISFGVKVVETVGYDKIHRKQTTFHNLGEIALVDYKISGTGSFTPEILPIIDMDQIWMQLNNVFELDLSKNLISNWDIVNEIVGSLPGLKCLRLNRNRFAPLLNQSQGSIQGLIHLSQLRVLSLAQTFLSWTEIPILSMVLTGLSELSIAGNDYIDIPDDLTFSWQSLVKLDLEGNRLCAWRNILSLSSYFPALESLNLKRNAFNKSFDHNAKTFTINNTFNYLTAINLADNNIDSWAFIDDLSKADIFPKLQDLRLERNPLHRVAGSLAFQVQAVSRLENLLKLNGSTVAEKDRLECEIYYVNMCARQRSEFLGSGSSSELANFDSCNPRFLTLAKKHDLPIIQASNAFSAVNQGIIKKTLVEVEMKIDSSHQTITKKLPRTMSIKQIRQLAEKLFKQQFHGTLGVPLEEEDNTISEDQETEEYIEIDQPCTTEKIDISQTAISPKLQKDAGDEKASAIPGKQSNKEIDLSTTKPDNHESHDCILQVDRYPAQNAFVPKKSWLLRLFQSRDFFSPWIAVTYLYRYADAAVQDYLCQRILHSFPVEQILFYLPQLCHLLVIRPDESAFIENLLLELSLRSEHFSLCLLWYMEGYLSDLKNAANPTSSSRRKASSNKNSSAAPDHALKALYTCSKVYSKCNALLFHPQSKEWRDMVKSNSQFHSITNPNGIGSGDCSDCGQGFLSPVLTTNRTRISENVKPTFLAIGGILGAIAQPKLVSQMQRMALILGRQRNISNQGSQANNYDQLYSPSSGSKMSHSQSLPDIGTSPGPVTTAIDNIPTPKSPFLARLEMLQKPLWGKFTKKLPSLEDVTSGKAFSYEIYLSNRDFEVKKAISSLGPNPSFNDSSSPAPASSPHFSVPIGGQDSRKDDGKTSISSPEWTGFYIHNEIRFLQMLINISTRLVNVPRPSRQQTLQAELTLLNHNLPADVCLPFWCGKDHRRCEDFGKNVELEMFHDKVVRIPPNDGVTLNSADRVPILILVEVLENEARDAETIRKDLHDSLALDIQTNPSTSDILAMHRNDTSASLNVILENGPGDVGVTASKSVTPTSFRSPLSSVIAEGGDHNSIEKASSPILTFSPRLTKIGPVTVVERESMERDMGKDNNEVAEKKVDCFVDIPLSGNTTNNNFLSHSHTGEKYNADEGGADDVFLDSPDDFASSPKSASSRPENRRQSLSNKKYQQQRQNRKSSLEDLEKISDHMKAAAIMLAQLDAKLGSDKGGSGVGSAVPGGRSKSRPSVSSLDEVSRLRERLLAEMKVLEERRYKDRLKLAQVETYSLNENDVALAKEDPSAVVLKESWMEKENRIRSTSPFGHLPNWRLHSLIIKSGADLRQEQLACQLIQEISNILLEDKVPCWIYCFRVLPLSDNSGMIETIKNTLSVHSIKKDGYVNGYNPTEMPFTLYDHFVRTFGDPSGDNFIAAQDSFMRSLAGYSVLTYLLQIRDRHNGNILIDREGHMIHIDFGFMLSNSPGSVGFESAPFKLVQDYVDILGGFESPKFVEFRNLMVVAMLSLRKHFERIVTLVEIMQKESNFPCFIAGEATLSMLKDRFHLSLTDSQVGELVQQLITSSYGNTFTRLYDSFQYYANKIL